jgi:hypothetical protein
MNRSEFKEFPWVAPWQPISEQGREAYEHELGLEVGLDHPLYAVKVQAVARTCDSDDVLFITQDHAAGLAVVHLTFRGRQEKDPKWPSVILYRDLDHWISRRMLPDAARFEIDESSQAA